MWSANRWHANGKTITLIRKQYDDEAVTLMKDTTDNKIDMDNILPQTLKSRLLIPDYESSDTCDKRCG